MIGVILLLAIARGIVLSNGSRMLDLSDQVVLVHGPHGVSGKIESITRSKGPAIAGAGGDEVHSFFFLHPSLGKRFAVSFLCKDAWIIVKLVFGIADDLAHSLFV